MAEIPDKYSDLDFVPPKAAQENAQKALRWREEHGSEIDAGTRVGWVRANQLAKGKELSPDVVRRMAQFNRHRSNSEIANQYEGEPWKDNGYLAWQLWGGDEGVDWAKRKTDQMDRRDKQQNESSIPREDEMKNLKEERLRRVIREIVDETLYGREFGTNYTFFDKNSDEKLGSFTSHNTKLVVFRESEERVYMKVTNKRTGETSDKIYIEDVKELQDFLNVVNVIA